MITSGARNFCRQTRAPLSGEVFLPPHSSRMVLSDLALGAGGGGGGGEASGGRKWRTPGNSSCGFLNHSILTTTLCAIGNHQDKAVCFSWHAHRGENRRRGIIRGTGMGKVSNGAALTAVYFRLLHISKDYVWRNC